MIGWIVDRVWAWRHQADLQQLDAQAAFLDAEGERIERKMVEMFGPDWRAEAERRLADRLSGVYTTS